MLLKGQRRARSQPAPPWRGVSQCSASARGGLVRCDEHGIALRDCIGTGGMPSGLTIAPKALEMYAVAIVESERLLAS